MTTPLRAPPARILHARYRVARASLLARPEGPVEAVDLATGTAVTLQRGEHGWSPCERQRDPELIGFQAIPVVREPSRRWGGSRRQIAGLAGALAVGIACAGFARGAIDHGGSAARAIERRATPSAEAASVARPAGAPAAERRQRGGPAVAVARPVPHRLRAPGLGATVVAAVPRLRSPSSSRPASPPSLPLPAVAIEPLDGQARLPD